jgi:hypothetical protein
MEPDFGVVLALAARDAGDAARAAGLMADVANGSGRPDLQALAAAAPAAWPANLRQIQAAAARRAP